jgi:hypothetical protein
VEVRVKVGVRVIVGVVLLVNVAEGDWVPVVVKVAVTEGVGLKVMVKVAVGVEVTNTAGSWVGVRLVWAKTKAGIVRATPRDNLTSSFT